MKIELLEKMIELCEQIQWYEKRISNRKDELTAYYGFFPELVKNIQHKISLYEVYIEFLNDKLNRLKLEL